MWLIFIIYILALGFFIYLCDDIPSIIFAICSITLLFGLGSLSIMDNERLMKECMKDHKEYECVSMLRDRND